VSSASGGMSSWLLALPFAVGCLAWGLTLLISWVTKTPDPASNLPKATLLASFWLSYLMLILTVVLEMRHFGLRSRRASWWAYRLALFANAPIPIALTIAYSEAYLGISLWPPPPPLIAVQFLLIPVYVAGFLFPVVSWAVVAFLCFFKDRSSKMPGRMLPAAFAFPGSMAHCFIALAYVMSI